MQIIPKPIRIHSQYQCTKQFNSRFSRAKTAAVLGIGVLPVSKNTSVAKLSWVMLCRQCS